MTYRIKLNCLSKAPQIIKSELKLNGITVSTVGNGLDVNKLRKALQTFFPFGSLVRLSSEDVKESTYREEVIFYFKSFRKIKDIANIEGINRSLYELKVETIDG